jgi:large subunit ribosomal protein L6
MSRIGKEPIKIPEGVQVTVSEDNVVTVKGPKGTVEQKVPKMMKITQENGILHVERPYDSNQMKALHGLTRALINSMVIGTHTEFSKTLKINGVGYKAALAGKNLNLSLGYSHPIVVDAPEGVTFEVPDSNTIIVKSPDKQKCGQLAAIIRSKRPPEPYLGKGIKYEDERIRRKAGKAGK